MAEELQLKKIRGEGKEREGWVNSKSQMEISLMCYNRAANDSEIMLMFKYFNHFLILFSKKKTVWSCFTTLSVKLVKSSIKLISIIMKALNTCIRHERIAI